MEFGFYDQYILFTECVRFLFCCCNIWLAENVSVSKSIIKKKMHAWKIVIFIVINIPQNRKEVFSVLNLACSYLLGCSRSLTVLGKANYTTASLPGHHGFITLATGFNQKGLDKMWASCNSEKHCVGLANQWWGITKALKGFTVTVGLEALSPSCLLPQPGGNYM